MLFRGINGGGGVLLKGSPSRGKLVLLLRSTRVGLDVDSRRLAFSDSLALKGVSFSGRLETGMFPCSREGFRVNEAIFE